MKLAFPFMAGLMLWTVSASARDYCPDRPGIDTPPCVIDIGHWSTEASIADWSKASSPDAVSEAILLGDLALRTGIADHTEARVAWTAFAHLRSRDRASGAVQNRTGTGDVTLGIKRNLIDPDGKSLSIALLPSVTLPTGTQAIGAGDWGAGLQVPVNIRANGYVSLMLTPEIDAAVDSDRSGRHLRYGTAGGIAFALRKNFDIEIESAITRDRDPAGGSTQAVAAFAAGLTIGADTQVDVGSEFGLTPQSPDAHLYFGIARRF